MRKTVFCACNGEESWQSWRCTKGHTAQNKTKHKKDMKKTSYFEMLQSAREWIEKNGATEANIEHLRKILPDAWAAEIISDVLGRNNLSF